MDWKLILQTLAVFGLAMSIATVFVDSTEHRARVLVGDFPGSALMRLPGRGPPGVFVHGLFLGLVNSVWITSAHLAFFDRYVAGRPQEAAMLKSMPASPKLMMAFTGLVAGLISGVVIGLLAWVAGKMVKQPLRDAKGTAA